MFKKTRRLLAYLLIVCMMVNMMPTSLYAEDDKPDDSSQSNSYTVDDCTVECEDILYDGFAHGPAPVVTLPASALDPQGGADEVYVLKEGVDYRLEYKLESEAKSYTYKIIGLGGILSGEKEFTWYIKMTPFSSERISARVLNPGASVDEVQYLVYDTVKGTRLEMNVDFTSNYQPKSEPGEYTFQLSGLGLY